MTARRFVPILLLGAIWALRHPYEGMIHDGILYAGQALRHIHPQVFAADLFFGDSSQDDFTLFGRGYAILVDRLGLTLGGATLFALAQLGWFAVALAWIRETAPRLALAGVACLLALRYPYAVDGRLELAESFTTARLVAEPLALLAILLALRGRVGAGLAILAFAIAVHPLVALPTLAVLIAVGLVGQLGWQRTVGCVIAVVAVAAVVAAVLPYRLDDEWMRLVEIRSGFAVPSGWTVDGVARWAAALLMLLIAASFVPGEYGRLWRCVALVGAAGIVLSVVAQLLRSAPLIQLQGWRAMWLVVWFAPLAVLGSVAAVAPEDRVLRLRLLAMIPTFALAQFSWVPGLGVVALVYNLTFGATLLMRPALVRTGATGPAVLACFAFSALALVAGALELAAVARASTPLDPTDRTLATLAIRDLGWLSAAGVGWWVGSSATPASGARMRFGAAVLATLAILLADARPPVARNAQLPGSDAIQQWRELVPDSAQVLWVNRQRYVWFGLHRASYVSSAQSAGIVFDRATALEAYRRRAVIESLSLRDAAFTIEPIAATVVEPIPTRLDLEQACIADDRLGFVILDADLGRSRGTPYIEPFSGRTYRLYACSDFR